MLYTSEPSTATGTEATPLDANAIFIIDYSNHEEQYKINPITPG